MLQHQIVQSPARLGLTNPNSPSLSNPNPSPSPNPNPNTPPKFTPTPTTSTSSHQSLPTTTTAATATATATTTTTTSSTLLSLLPPLPRAQSLLLQMASLASKLFEVTPNRSFWLTSFRGNLPTFLSSQTQSIPQPVAEPTPSSTKEIFSQFTSLQTQLFEVVAELQEILDLQDARQKIAREIRSRDSALLSFANKLKDAERVLDILVDDYTDYMRPKRSKSDNGMDETTVASQLNLSDIISYAHRISYTTFAPPEFGAGQAPLRGALPPAPQEEQMRASQLYNFADLDVGLPKTADSKEKTVEPIIEPQQLADANPLANLAAIQGLLPPNVTIPSGWKPGMPVELPTDLPIPPPGWKPGDPVPLPPLDGLPTKEQQPRPFVPQPMHKEPEPIQVRHVDLELPDNFDDSSDYSSDEGSSEEED